MAELETEKYRFRYVRSAGGELSGPSFVIQTELAISELGNTALDNTEEALENSRQALENSENALSIVNSAQADASLALTVAYDARERANNAADAASQAQKTADQAVSDAAAAQSTADAAQSTADYAQETAESALELARTANTAAENAQNTADNAETKADAAQESADAAQSTADSAQSTADTNSDLIAALQESLSETASDLRSEIQKAGFLFELDESTTDIDDIFGTVSKKYFTQNVTTAPAGVSAPYWFWTFVRDDGERCVQWLRTTDGTLYSRDGSMGASTYGEGTDTFWSIAIPGQSTELDLSLTCTADGTFSADAAGGTVASATMSGNHFLVSLEIPLEEDVTSGDITWDGMVLGTVDGATITNEGGARASGSYCTIQIDNGNIYDSTMYLYLTGDWTDYVSGETTWSDWATLSGGSGGISASQVAIQMVASTPNCYRRASLMTPHQTYVTIHADTQVRIGDNGYISTADVDLQLDDYISASARAGTDLYVYACAPTAGTEPVFVLSANSTVPDGYDADNSRKIGGFHCLCLAVGTISDNALSGYATGDILPTTVWDLLHRAETDNQEGLYYFNGAWHTIYLLSWDGEKFVSVFGANPSRGTSDYPVHGERFAELLPKQGMRLPSRDEFIAFAKGSNEGTESTYGASPHEAGGHVDTAGRRMISDCGAEDCCGAMYQWTSDTYGAFNRLAGTSFSQSVAQYGGGDLNGSYYLNGYNNDETVGTWSDRLMNSDVDGTANYGKGYGVIVRYLVGGKSGDDNGGSRSVRLDNLSARVNSAYGARGASGPRAVGTL